MRAACYIRVSTEEQAREGYSIDSQKEVCLRWIKEKGHDLVDIYVDEGYSSKNLKRPDVQRMIGDIKNRRFNLLVFWRLNRVTRRVKDKEVLFELFDYHRIDLKSMTEEIDTTTASGRMVTNILVSVAQGEREQTAENVFGTMYENAVKGMRQGAVAPFGYKLVDSKLVVDPLEAEIVKRIFKLYQQNKSFRAIAKLFNNPSNPVPKRQTSKWAEFTVGYIVTNPVYCGMLRWNYRKASGKPTGQEIIVNADHEPIISVEEFERVQQLKNKRARFGKRVTSDYIFTGVLKCSRCGYNLVGVSYKRKGGHTLYYKCLGRFNYGLCDMPLIKEETVIREFLSNFRADSALGKKLINANHADDNEKQDRNEEIKKQLEEITRRKKKWQEAFANDVISLDDLRARTNEDRQREEYLLSQLEVATTFQKSYTVDELRDMLSTFTEFWHGISETVAKKEFIQEAFQEIKIEAERDHVPSPGSFVPIEILDWKLSSGII